MTHANITKDFCVMSEVICEASKLGKPVAGNNDQIKKLR